MYKIAILGCENSHAKSFLDLIEQGLYPQISVVGIYSDEQEPMKKLCERYGVPAMEKPDALVGKIDGIMITARHGNNHYKYAKPYLNDHIPMFIDKPITCKEDEAVQFMREAKDCGVRLCGGSTIASRPQTLALAQDVRDHTLGEPVGGSVVCPYYPDSAYGGFYFYAQHLVDTMTTVFGVGIRRVLAEKKAGAMILTAGYDTFSVHGTYVTSGGYYSATLYGSKGIRTEEITFDGKSFCSEMDEMLHLLEGGEMKKSYEEFILPVYVMNAIARSVDSGNWEAIPKIQI